MPKLEKSKITQAKTSATESLKNAEKEEQEKKVKVDEISDFIKFYALPIFSAMIFLGVVFFTIIPSIRYIFDSIDEIDALKNEDQTMNSRIERLIALQQENADQVQLINRINSIVPTGKSEVVAFRERIATTGLQQSLLLEESKSGETILEPESVTVETAEGFNLIEIPSEFNMRGEFINFRNFLNSLYIGDDFFIVEEMSLNASSAEGEENIWFGTFNLTKYQFFADENFDLETTFAGVDEFEEPDPTAINFLETKFIDN